MPLPYGWNSRSHSMLEWVGDASIGNVTEIDDLRDNAERFRRLARVVADERNQRQLCEMAAKLDEQADSLEERARRNDQRED